MTRDEIIEHEAELVYQTYHRVAGEPCCPWSALSERGKRAWREASQAGVRARITRVASGLTKSLQEDLMSGNPTLHSSDCARHNEPAEKAGECDCNEFDRISSNVPGLDGLKLMDGKVREG